MALGHYEVRIMANIFGTTSNGFAYEGEYEPSVNGSVRWMATFRFHGIYRGMRHGRVFDVSKLPTADLQTAVKDDIEGVWVNVH